MKTVLLLLVILVISNAHAQRRVEVLGVGITTFRVEQIDSQVLNSVSVAHGQSGALQRHIDSQFEGMRAAPGGLQSVADLIGRVGESLYNGISNMFNPEEPFVPTNVINPGQAGYNTDLSGYSFYWLLPLSAEDRARAMSLYSMLLSDTGNLDPVIREIIERGYIDILVELYGEENANMLVAEYHSSNENTESEEESEEESDRVPASTGASPQSHNGTLPGNSNFPGSGFPSGFGAQQSGSGAQQRPGQSHTGIVSVGGVVSETTVGSGPTQGPTDASGGSGIQQINVIDRQHGSVDPGSISDGGIYSSQLLNTINITRLSNRQVEELIESLRNNGENDKADAVERALHDRRVAQFQDYANVALGINEGLSATMNNLCRGSQAFTHMQRCIQDNAVAQVDAISEDPTVLDSIHASCAQQADDQFPQYVICSWFDSRIVNFAPRLGEP